jgi:hypothetical protein
MQTRQRDSNSRTAGTPPERPATAAQQMIRPIFAALAIDLLDLVTSGPLGLYTGLILGAATGFWLAPLLGFPPHRRWLAALVTGVYCTLPLTGLIPLATLASVLSRAPVGGNPRVDAAGDTESAGAIDVEYEVVSDEVKGQGDRSGNDSTSNEGPHGG